MFVVIVILVPVQLPLLLTGKYFMGTVDHFGYHHRGMEMEVQLETDTEMGTDTEYNGVFESGDDVYDPPDGRKTCCTIGASATTLGTSAFMKLHDRWKLRPDLASPSGLGVDPIRSWDIHTM
ncbi:hypothetical protein BJ138DRAFT_1097057 [Hygrophoropsis aurantiaca]|uniref:Uncharacterized protein n=1 Tax=Hygrophoropsis aurantiaca TaxID=72124 RepID=A0ACB8AT97_9AGAM|nr:hypothetical protein BJ138DRAFT_1097057 [Hygrophoropsis aurantiaca]